MAKKEMTIAELEVELKKAEKAGDAEAVEKLEKQIADAKAKEEADEKAKANKTASASDKAKLKVDDVKVEVIESIPQFFFGGKIHSIKIGQKITISKAMKDILVKRGAVKVL